MDLLYSDRLFILEPEVLTDHDERELTILQMQ